MIYGIFLMKKILPFPGQQTLHPFLNHKHNPIELVKYITHLNKDCVIMCFDVIIKMSFCKRISEAIAENETQTNFIVICSWEENSRTSHQSQINPFKVVQHY